MQRSLLSKAFPIIALTFVDVLGLTIILPLLHLYAIRYDASPVQIGLTAAAFPLAQLIGVPVMGALSDRYGRKPLLLISQVTTCISFLMLASATSLEMVILSRVFDGLFGANLATAQAAITDITDEKTRAQGLGLTGAAFGSGFLIGPAIALIALDFTDNLAMPALIAAGYSFLSILITTFGFKESLPREKRAGYSNHVESPIPPGAEATRLSIGRKPTEGASITLEDVSGEAKTYEREPQRGVPTGEMGIWGRIKAGIAGSPWVKVARKPGINALLVLMFAQQLVFFAFESLLGLFILSRLGLLGQGTSLVFIYVGVILITVQVRLIGRWSRKYGEARVMRIALAALGVGLLLVAFTPASPHPFYVRSLTELELHEVRPDSTESIIGEIPVELPEDSARGLGGILWFAAAAIPLTIGAGLIRPSLNSLMIARGNDGERGAILGVSASAVSLADAAAPLIGGWLFQSYGSSAPFAVGGVVMIGLLGVSLVMVKQKIAVSS